MSFWMKNVTQSFANIEGEMWIVYAADDEIDFYIVVMIYGKRFKMAHYERILNANYTF